MQRCVAIWAPTPNWINRSHGQDQMNNSRRQFILNACAWAVGTVLARPFGVSAQTPSTLPGQSVWKFLTGYGSQVQAVGGSVIGLLRGQFPLLTKVRLAVDMSALKMLETFPIKPVYASGNVIECLEQNALIQIERLTALGFQQAVASPVRPMYGHEALIYDLADGELLDVYGALHNRQLQLLSWPANLESVFSTYLTGRIDSQLYGLEASAPFLQLQGSALHQAVSSLQTAKAILVDCVTNFPLLAKLGGNPLVESILGSPTLESVLSLFGASYPSLSGRVAQLIAADPSSAIDGAAWLAVTEHAKQFQLITGLFNDPLSRSLWGRQSLAHAGLLITRFPTLLSG